MQAITTKYLPATNTKGARIKASCEAGSVTISYPHEAQNAFAAHALAMYRLALKLEFKAYLAAYDGVVMPGRVAGIEYAPGEWAFLPEHGLEFA